MEASEPNLPKSDKLFANEPLGPDCLSARGEARVDGRRVSFARGGRGL